jgi:hypothetical protein
VFVKKEKKNNYNTFFVVFSTSRFNSILSFFFNKTPNIIRLFNPIKLLVK